jgi:hypothetical protein
MVHFKDVFISYSRRNLDFAQRLYTELTTHTLDVWFDHNDIPLAVDFQYQIDEGIQKAHNFVFVISPSSLRSEYCAKEVDMAVKCGKRIIPILYEMPTHEDMPYMHKSIEKLNWVYMRENTDDFEKAITGILQVISSFEEYVTTHTKLLNEAIVWEEQRKNHKYLLVNTARRQAEQWLLKEFDDLPPCSPPDILCEYICESRENAENLMSDVYITSDKEDRDWVAVIHKALQRYGATTWTYQTDFRIGTNYEQASKQGIEEADNFIIVISNKLTIYDDAIKELNYALSLNKRILPIVIEEIDRYNLPASLREMQLINLIGKENDREAIADALFSWLDDEKAYYQQHKIILTQAIKWEHQQKNPSILLQGYRLENAQTWLKINQNRRNQPPTAKQVKFIEASATAKGSLSTEVFISYSRTDSDFTRFLNNELQMYGKTTWFDQENISSGADFQQEIYNGIAASDNFVFIISPDSVNSSYCVEEVEYARKLNKRFITVLYRQTELHEIPKTLKTIQWIDATNADFHQVFTELIRALDTDRNHVQLHTKWANKAIEWEQKEKENSFLLRGSELGLASLWLKNTEEEQKKPAPTALQEAFIEESIKFQNKEESAKKQRKQNLLILAMAGISILIGAGAYFVNDQIDINNLKKERETIRTMVFELAAEREELALKRDSIDNLLRGTIASHIITEKNRTAQLTGVHKEKMTVQQQLQYQSRRADSLQRKINNYFLPMESHVTQLHGVKVELDETNHRFTQFLKFNSRLKAAEQNLLQNFNDRYHEIEKKLEQLTK